MKENVAVGLTGGCAGAHTMDSEDEAAEMNVTLSNVYRNFLRSLLDSN